jgi:prepilin-type N-terminal cleavage/methylation domain-containing protein
MRFSNPPNRTRRSCQQHAFTLAEVVIAIAIITLVFSGTIMSYVQTTRRAEWTGYSLAAQALAVQQIEQARSAVWDPAQWPVLNQVTNLNLLNRSYNASTRVMTGYTWTSLDVPISGMGGGPTYATNFVTIRMVTNITAVTAVAVQMVQVDTVWAWKVGNPPRLFTNTIATYIAPDNRDPDTL